uniref:Uncharacterized protein n=1 Tax=viral metagenome TaxID=1070528 RepID=A0A6C0AU96_9ZZZZ
MECVATARGITLLHGDATTDEAVVRVAHAPPAFVAALQAALLNDVPCVGTHTLWLDDAPKYVHGDVLALRAAQCGWKVLPARSGSAGACASHDAEHPSDAFGAPAARGSFDFVAGPATGFELRAEHVAWDTACVVPTHPQAVLAALPPGARCAGELVLAWGTARHGPAWRAVPRVAWDSGATLEWLTDPAQLPPAQVATLCDVLADDVDAVVGDGVAVGQPFEVRAHAGMQELADAPEWRGVLKYSTHTPDDCTDHIMTVRTNGQMPALTAIVTALRVMAADASAVVQGCT